MTVYRLFPYDESAAPNERGGALFVPPGGRNRIDNPRSYSVLYVAANPEAAIAETFGRLAVWTPETFLHSSGRSYALAAYEIPDDLAIFNLDDVDALKTIGIMRPTNVITRDRAKTQAWAQTIFDIGTYEGASWWSYYRPDWTIIGLWNYGSVRLMGTAHTVTSSSAVVQATAAPIVRQIAP